MCYSGKQKEAEPFVFQRDSAIAKIFSKKIFDSLKNSLGGRFYRL